MSRLPLQDSGKTVELRGGPLDGLCIRVASAMNGTWLPAMRDSSVVLVEYHKPTAVVVADREVWVYKPSAF
jgi:hypothetical protein